MPDRILSGIAELIALALSVLYLLSEPANASMLIVGVFK